METGAVLCLLFLFSVCYIVCLFFLGHAYQPKLLVWWKKGHCSGDLCFLQSSLEDVPTSPNTALVIFPVSPGFTRYEEILVGHHGIEDLRTHLLMTWSSPVLPLKPNFPKRSRLCWFTGFMTWLSSLEMNFNIFSKKFYFILCVLPACMSTHHMHVVPTQARRGH